MDKKCFKKYFLTISEGRDTTIIEYRTGNSFVATNFVETGIEHHFCQNEQK